MPEFMNRMGTLRTRPVPRQPGIKTKTPESGTDIEKFFVFDELLPDPE